MTRVDQGPPLEKDFFVRFYFERERTRKGFKYRCAFPTARTVLLLLSTYSAGGVQREQDERGGCVRGRGGGSSGGDVSAAAGVDPLTWGVGAAGFSVARCNATPFVFLQKAAERRQEGVHSQFQGTRSQPSSPVWSLGLEHLHTPSLESRHSGTLLFLFTATH